MDRPANISIGCSSREPDRISESPLHGNRIRVLIIDDHPIVRFGLGSFLKMQKDLEVVNAVASGIEALELLHKVSVDVILVDLRMPALSGIETLASIASVAPRARSVVLSSFEYDEEIYAAVKAGAQGYVHKEASPEDILRSIRLVHSGKKTFPRRIAERLASRQIASELTERERQILDLVAKGLTNKEVARILRLSQFTVRNHLNRITTKLDVSDRTEAVFLAIQKGIIKSD